MSRQRWIMVLALLGFVTTVGADVLWGTWWGAFGYAVLVLYISLKPDRPRPQHAVGGPPRPPRRRLDMGSMTWEEEERWRRRFGVQPDGSNAAGWDAGWGALDAGGGWDGGVDWPPPSGEPYRGLPPPDLEVDWQPVRPPVIPPRGEPWERYEPAEVAHEDDDADWARRLREELEDLPEMGTELPGAGEGAGEAEDQGGTCGGGSPAPAPGTWPAHAQGFCQPGCFWCDIESERLAHTFDMPAITESTVEDWGARMCREVEGWHNEPWAIG